jgi:hypothetical protein
VKTWSQPAYAQHLQVLDVIPPPELQPRRKIGLIELGTQQLHGDERDVYSSDPKKDQRQSSEKSNGDLWHRSAEQIQEVGNRNKSPLTGLQRAWGSDLHPSKFIIKRMTNALTKDAVIHPFTFHT